MITKRMFLLSTFGVITLGIIAYLYTAKPSIPSLVPCDNSISRCVVLDEINKLRSAKGLSALSFDKKLCLAAKRFVDDSEAKYPNKVRTSTYTTGIGFSQTASSSFTPLDMWVEIERKNSGSSIISDDSALLSFKNSDEIYLDKITYGCVAISSGNVGYKPFAIFLGGVKQ